MEQNKVKQKGEPKKEDFGSPVFLGRKIAAPGKTLRVRIEVIPKGTVLHRCHDAQYPGDSFNPGRILLPHEYGARFSPIRDAALDLIPTMYLASSCEAAIAESVFHDVIATGKTEFFDLRPFTHMHYIQLKLERDLNVVSCRAQDCLYMGIDRDELIGSTQLEYSQTRAWSQAIYQQHHNVDGMKWYSKRNDDHFAMILFGGQRVMDSELSIAEPSSRLLSHKAIGQIIQKTAERLGLILTEE
ncbi:RES domain [Serratia fonticola]|uniref:RES family NAD+ phosphorylase n=1 Tax=Serratia fonticola TaxID=47917 RepID=UPI00217881C0|nr:RES family NAD+ phosphorylase [Serratia fonticola]CAI1748260.1 RES domain [Serratia fonticola]